MRMVNIVRVRSRTRVVIMVVRRIRIHSRVNILIHNIILYSVLMRIRKNGRYRVRNCIGIIIIRTRMVTTRRISRSMCIVDIIRRIGIIRIHSRCRIRMMIGHIIR